MKNLLKKSGWADILVSAVLAIIGIFMIAKTDLAIKIIASIIGIVFITLGVIRCIDYFLARGKSELYNYNLFYGIIAITIGIITICCSNFVESVFRIMISLWIIYSGLMRLSLSIKLHTAQIDIWNISLILSIIMVIGGLYMLFQSGALVLTIGIIILVYSIIDIIESSIFMKYVDDLL